MYILNRVSNKLVPKTPFKLWTGRTPSLRHMYVWGCPGELRLYNSHERKFDPRSVRRYFIDYPKRCKGYRFWYPNHSMRIVETTNVKFIELNEISVCT